MADQPRVSTRAMKKGAYHPHWEHYAPCREKECKAEAGDRCVNVRGEWMPRPHRGRSRTDPTRRFDLVDSGEL